MKIRVAFLSVLAVSTSIVVSAQEHDDMYFRSKDRTKLQASRPMKLKSMSSEHEMATATTINPTDSYSARNVNPEYISQSKVGSGSSEPAPYFIPDYAPTGVNQNISTNSISPSMAGYYPYYGGMNSGFGSPYSSLYSPMYGGGYNPYGYNSYNSGWSSMLSLGFGMGSGYSPYGSMYSPYCNNFYGMNSAYNMGMGYGYYPTTVVVMNNDAYGRNVVYGKRASRTKDINNYVNPNNRSTAMMTTTDSQGRERGANGRISSNEISSYYQRGWRTNPETSGTTSTRSNWGSSSRIGDSDNTDFRTNSGFNNSRSSSNSIFDNGGSRSSWNNNSGSNFSSGGGSRTSTTSGGSSGARRGRD